MKPNDKIELVQGGQNRNGVFEPRVSANDLLNPAPAPVLTPPTQPSINQNTMRTVSNVAKNINGIIEADTAESQRLKQLREEQSAFGFSGADIYNQNLQDNGVNTNLAELKDINLQLADMQTASDLTKSRIAGAEGQTLSQGQRELTQEEKEAGIRQMGLSARASVLTDNINTATALARDAVNFAFQDAQLANQNRTNQINDLRSTVDAQTQQLLDAELREIEKEEARIKEVKDAVQGAILAGAPQSDIDAMLSPATSDEEKLRIAQNAQAVSARTDIGLQRELQRAQIASANRANQPSERLRPTTIIEQDGKKLLIDSQTGEVIQDFGATSQSVGELTLLKQVDEIQATDDLLTHPGLNSAVGPTGLARIGIIDGFTGATDEFIGAVDSLTKGLTIDELLEKKAEGATFGALNEQEFKTLEQSATKINAWRMTNDDGRTTGYDTSEDALKDEIDIINGYRRLDAVFKGGDPSAVGITITPDGSYWTEAHDGSLIKLR